MDHNISNTASDTKTENVANNYYPYDTSLHQDGHKTYNERTLDVYYTATQICIKSSGRIILP